MMTREYRLDRDYNGLTEGQIVYLYNGHDYGLATMIECEGMKKGQELPIILYGRVKVSEGVEKAINAMTAEFLRLALEYQNTLTKAGKPKKV